MVLRRSQRIKAALRNIVRRNSLKSMKTRRIVQSFCEDSGLVYFGTVDQRRDEHEVIRGLTASPEHIDEHFSVGSVEDYDVSLAYRTDSFEGADRQVVTHSWLIMAFKLRTRGLPHIFIGGHDHVSSAYARLFMTHTGMHALPADHNHAGSAEFFSRYQIYTQAAHFLEVRHLFTPELTRTLAAHFWPLSLELQDGMLYVYADNQAVTPQLLNAMLKNGLWLAGRIDSAND